MTKYYHRLILICFSNEGLYDISLSVFAAMTTESREGMAQTAALLDAAIDFTGGTLGGVASVVVGQPLDTVKVRLLMAYVIMIRLIS